MRNTCEDFFITQIENDGEEKIENLEEKVIEQPFTNILKDTLFVDENQKFFKEQKLQENSEINLLNNNYKLLPTKSELNINTTNDPTLEINRPITYQLNQENTKSCDKCNKDLIIEYKEYESNQAHYQIKEKCEVKDLIGYHKLYEILYFSYFHIKDKNNETNLENKIIKCYRRYDNFDKFNSKLRNKYPYLIIPKLTPKNPMAKILTPEEDFYVNRERQLNFYLNFIFKNEFLSKTKEFIKFTNDSEFDEGFFNNNEDGQYFFPESIKISETLTNKILGVFSGIIGGGSERKLADTEIKLRTMETHYKGILDKYKEIKINITNYLRTFKIKSQDYEQFSSTCVYMKDTLFNVPHSRDNFKRFKEICDYTSEINRNHYQHAAIKLENKFDVILF
jgi:hypothetical protein